jgi:hypothetical protein
MLANFLKLHRNYVWIAAILIAVSLRFGFALLGNNFDMESYWIVGQAVAAGENVYAATHRYNYGPIWFAIVGLVYQISTGFVMFRLLIAGVLIATDLGIARILYSKFGYVAALAFLFNPISIFITGYHSQFDNLAILFGLISVVLLNGGLNWRQRNSWFGLVMLGISLMTKHILFLFPFWLALKQKGFFNKFIAAFVPISLFALGFVPFWSTGSQGIINNVFLYRSFNNAPFWLGWMPGVIVNNVPLFALFIGTLSLLGIIWRKQELTKTLLLYLVALVLFSSSVANQYVAITVPFLAVYWRSIFLQGYSLLTFTYLMADPAAGLGWIKDTDSLWFRVLAFNFQAGLLFLGLVDTLRPQAFSTLVTRAKNWVKEEALWQWRSIYNPRD